MHEGEMRNAAVPRRMLRFYDMFRSVAVLRWARTVFALFGTRRAATSDVHRLRVIVPCGTTVAPLETLRRSRQPTRPETGRRRHLRLVAPGA